MTPVWPFTSDCRAGKHRGLNRRFLTVLLLISVQFVACMDRGAAIAAPAVRDAGGLADHVKRTSASRDDCTRGEPDSLLASRSAFNRESASEAQEIVRTNSPIKLTIRHFGCTHYALDFEFAWPGAHMPPPEKSIKEAANLLQKLPFKHDYESLARRLIASLRKMADEPYKQPVNMSETETLTATTPALNVIKLRYDVAL